ncbi:hypothetical protein V7S43_015174 [Phytophthora oleae]|uniref:Uncharacterized protein n=1 Tax=Phytophthora oleae TaxID=2107226 RepID=A0ABD3F1K9_9STRA
MDSIEWLLGNFPQSEHISAYCVLDEAARRGYLNILKYFHSLPSAPGFVSTTAKLRKADMDGVLLWSSSGTVMNVASRDAYRNVLDNRYWQRSSWNSTDAMDDS